MASLVQLQVPSSGTEYLDLDTLVRALDDWAVKKKFCFWTLKRETSEATFVCAKEGCSWCCRAKLTLLYDNDEEPSIWVLNILYKDHSCVG